MLPKLDFTSIVLGPLATLNLKDKKVTQTIRSRSYIDSLPFVDKPRVGKVFRITLDGKTIGKAEIKNIEVINLGKLGEEDAKAGGFGSYSELCRALQRAGFRFKPLSEYEGYKIEFLWLDNAHENVLKF